MTISPILKTLLITSLTICFGLLSGCATQPKSPSTVDSVSFGAKPTDYKNVIHSYLNKKKTSRESLHLDEIHYLNEPNKYVFEQFTQEKFGYRVCALIPIKDLNKLQSHFFLINNGKVTKHLHDSGLISLSSKFCSSELLAIRSKTKPMPAAVVASPVDKNGFKYITCQANDNETFFAFNPEKHLLVQEHDGKRVAELSIEKLTDTSIVATSTNRRISINRVSGTMIDNTKGTESKSNCQLSSQQRF